MTCLMLKGTIQRSGGSCRFSKGQVGIGDPVKSMTEPGTERADPAHPAVDPRDIQYHILRPAFLGLTLALLGYIDQARSRMGEALSLTRRINSAPLLAQV